ncbi:hypothetical protein H257_09915 [Aphanomyces astaci]|uniref:Uncharacterized protein n=1 Tax=Aphanomyces astaci TaxID=112090 RepID=W4G8C9_APHAT|nr:hypothetical protein H257_09915 [Aphanomyces astaci]ETV75957.1 hypothetical protein H257_09915 [Aphanomyces astaci]|eukprot:XP_009834599.1 hypothetical protein H257_09915 [Aphanomyces astaci]
MADATIVTPAVPDAPALALHAPIEAFALLENNNINQVHVLVVIPPLLRNVRRYERCASFCDRINYVVGTSALVVAVLYSTLPPGPACTSHCLCPGFNDTLSCALKGLVTVLPIALAFGLLVKCYLESKVKAAKETFKYGATVYT